MYLVVLLDGNFTHPILKVG